MLKKVVLGIVLLVVTTCVSLAIITLRYLDKEELRRVESEMVALTQQKDQLTALVNTLDEEQFKLEKEVEEKNKKISSNKLTIASLEKERLDNRWKVRSLRSENELEKSFALAFPQVINAKNFGIVKMPIKEGSPITLPYYVIPAWFSETFIIEHNHMLLYAEEIKQFKANEALYGNVIELKESVVQLQSEKAAAYQDGYDNAFTKYEQLNQDYIDLLKTPPSVEIKAPSLWPAIGGALLGLTLGIGF
jgi:hypothetical protein